MGQGPSKYWACALFVMYNKFFMGLIVYLILGPGKNNPTTIGRIFLVAVEDTN